MNSHHNNGENDRSLNETLDKFGESYAKLDKDEPPELLDMAILNSAHRALEKKPHWMKFGWLHGLTTAAVFVLALSVVIHQRESQPITEDGIDTGQLYRSQPERPAKLQSSGVQSDDLRQASKRKDNERREISESKAAEPAATPPAPLLEDTADAMTESMNVSHELQADTGPTDEDDRVGAGKIEVSNLPASTPMERSAQTGEVKQLTIPTAIAEPSVSLEETEESRQMDMEAEQQLLAIIKMKQSGNDNWKTELKAFIENHPDYPLPDELKN
jgi:hypothetical protein